MGNTNMREGLASEPGVDSASEVGSPSVDSASPASGFGHGARAVPLDASSAASLVSETDSSNPENTLSSERIAAIHERNDWLIAADQALADVRRRSYEGKLTTPDRWVKRAFAPSGAHLHPTCLPISKIAPMPRTHRREASRMFPWDMTTGLISTNSTLTTRCPSPR